MDLYQFITNSFSKYKCDQKNAENGSSKTDFELTGIRPLSIYPLPLTNDGLVTIEKIRISVFFSARADLKHGP